MRTYIFSQCVCKDLYMRFNFDSTMVSNRFSLKLTDKTYYYFINIIFIFMSNRCKNSNLQNKIII